MSQNTSHAVMAQRIEPADSRDFFPTPPWGARALCEHVIDTRWMDMRVWEPACGAGHMARPLSEYFRHVDATDLYDYGFGISGIDFLDGASLREERPDWIITNPPFNLAIEFAQTALRIAKVGVALLVRTSWTETNERYRLFSEHRPAVIAQFMGRLPMHRGKCERGASAATAYCWVVWDGPAEQTEWIMIPPAARANLERWGDYDGEIGLEPSVMPKRRRSA